MTYVSPSSLIFVVVFAIWATYFSVYVMRRREQLSTARSVDRFSAHMRILQRRSVKAVPRPEPITSSGNARTSILAAGASLESRAALDAASSAARAGLGAAGDPGGDAAVSRSGRQPAGFLTALVGRRDGSAGGAVVRSAARWADGATQAVARVGRVRRTPGRARPTATGAAVRPNRTFAAWGALTGLTGRQLRAVALLVGVVVALVTFPLTVLGHVAWLLPGFAGALSIGLLVWLRLDRRSDVAARRRRETAAAIEVERVEAEGDRCAALAAQEDALLADGSRRGAPVLPVAQEYVGVRASASDDIVPVDERIASQAETQGAGRRVVSSPEVPFDVTLFDPAPLSASAGGFVDGSLAGVEAYAPEGAVGSEGVVGSEGLVGSEQGVRDEPGLVPLEAASPWEIAADELPGGLDPSDPLVAERSWEPVPVPRPTYALKARAQRPLSAPEVPVPIEVEDDFDDVLWTPSQKVVNA